MNRLASLALTLSSLMVAACAAPPRVYHSRIASTGIGFDEAIAVELQSIVRADGNKSLTEVDQETITGCIGRAVREVNPRLVLAKAGEPHVRYLVRIAIRTVHTATQSEVALGDMPGMWGVGGKWKESTDFRAEVFDVKNRRLAGNLESWAVGEEGRGVLVLVVIPIFPIVYWSNTEKRACQALGKELARFIAEEPVTHTGLDGKTPILRVRPSSNGRVPGGQLYLVDRKNVTEAEAAATLILKFDNPSAAGDKSSRSDITANCAARTLAIGPMETFRTPDGSGTPTRAAATRETRVPDHNQPWVQSVLRAICENEQGDSEGRS
jgi:hypothetical protein